LVEDSYQNSVENNTVNGKPLVYLEDVANYSVGDAGQVILVNCTGIRVENLNLSHTSIGVQLWKTNNSIIVGSNITANNWYGIRFDSSSNNSIVENNITANNRDGILLYDSSNYNSIVGSNLTANNQYGIQLDHSSNNSIVGNTIANNRDGILLRSSSNNSIVGSNITANNRDGVWLYDSSNYNSLVGNNIANNWYGIRFSGSSNYNSISHNNFVDNSQQVYSYYTSTNIWDDGYLSGGNYWSDYEGVDADGDGVGDTPYTIDENNVDHYPLMGPFNSFNTSVGYSVDVISNSTIEDFRYFESNSTIVMHVSNMTANQTVGFCRLTIPHELIPPPYNITVNNTPVEYNIILENETVSIIYFTYKHSQLEIIIIPEHPTTMILLMLSITTAIVTILKRKTRTSNSK